MRAASVKEQGEGGYESGDAWRALGWRETLAGGEEPFAIATLVEIASRGGLDASWTETRECWAIRRCDRSAEALARLWFDFSQAPGLVGASLLDVKIEGTMPEPARKILWGAGVGASALLWRDEGDEGREPVFVEIREALEELRGLGLARGPARALSDPDVDACEADAALACRALIEAWAMEESCEGRGVSGRSGASL